MLVTWALCGALLGAPVAESPEMTELVRLEGVWNDAHLHGDAEALDRLWDADLVVTVPKMPVFTRAEALAVARSGRIHFERYETSALQVRTYGETGIVTGRLHRTRQLNGRQVDDDWQFTKVYIRRAGQWRVVAFHASDAPQ